MGVVSALTLPNLNSSTDEKEKGAYGKDIFFMILDSSGNFDFLGTPPTGNLTNLLALALGNHSDIAFWVIQNDNMYYLRRDSSGKCPNGSYLNWETKTSCK